MANFCKQIYHYKMNSKKFVKNLCNLEDIKYTDVVKILSDKTGNKYTYQSLYGKLARNTLRFNEVYILADTLGYDLELVKRK